jgi:hypothetical protein
MTATWRGYTGDMPDDEQGEQGEQGWLERRRAAKREKAERTGDSPEKRAAHERGDKDVQDAAAGAAIRGTLSTPPGGMGGGL